MEVRYAGRTDVGRKRTHNEDSFLLQPEDLLFVVCDGMGGHASGEVASRLAAEQISAFFESIRGNPEITWPYKGDKRLSEMERRLEVAVKWANYMVYEKANSALQYNRMGTTCVAIHFDEGACAIAHVGDSRCYRIRQGKIEQLTEDHSLLNQYIKLTHMTQEDIKAFPHKNIITRALGMKPTVEVDIQRHNVLPGDIFLLCCDGLSGEVEAEDMVRTVMEAKGDLNRACEELIALANRNGGRDNITVVLTEVVGI